MSLRLQDDPLKVRDAGQSFSWDPVHINVVVLQVKIQEGRRVTETDFTQRLHWNSAEKHHLCTELHALTNTKAYISSSKKESSSCTVQHGYKLQGCENIVSRSYGLYISIYTFTGRRPKETFFSN